MNEVGNKLMHNVYLHNDYDNFMHFFSADNDGKRYILQVEQMSSTLVNQGIAALEGLLANLKNSQRSYYAGALGIDLSSPLSFDDLQKQYYQKRAEITQATNVLEEYINGRGWTRGFANRYLQLTQQAIESGQDFTLQQISKKAFIQTIESANTLRAKDAQEIRKQFLAWLDKTDLNFSSDFTINIKAGTVTSSKLRGDGGEFVMQFIQEYILTNMQEELVSKEIAPRFIDFLASNIGTKYGRNVLGGGMGQLPLDTGFAQLQPDYQSTIDDIVITFGSQEKNYSEFLFDKKQGREYARRVFPILSIDYAARDLFKRLHEDDLLNLIGLNYFDDPSLDELTHEMQIENYILFYPMVNYMQYMNLREVRASSAGPLTNIMRQMNKLLAMLSVYRLSIGAEHGLSNAVQIEDSKFQSLRHSAASRSKTQEERETVMLSLEWNYINNFVVPTTIIVEQLINWLKGVQRQQAVRFTDMMISLDGSLFSPQQMYALQDAKRLAAKQSGVGGSSIDTWEYPPGVLQVGSEAGESIAARLRLKTDMILLIDEMRNVISQLIS